MLFNAFLWCISNTMTFPLGQVYFLGDLYTLKSLKPPMLWRWLVSPAGTFAALDICRMVKGIHTLWNHGFLMSPATQQKLPAMVLCLGQPPVRYLWCWLLLLFFINFCFSCYFAMPATLDLGFWGPWRPPPALSSTLATFDCLCFFSSIQALRFWLGIFYPQASFTLRSFPNIFDSTCVYQSLPGSRQFSLEVCRASSWSSKHKPGPSVYLIFCYLIYSNPQPWYSEEFFFEFYQILPWITCGKSVVYLLLTRFEFFSLVESICKDHKKHFEQDLYCLQTLR